MCLGLYHNERDRLKIKAFYLRLSVSGSRKPLPDSLTLYYPPRSINGSPLEINGSTIRPDSPGFLTLHRVLSGDVVFTSRDPVRASEGVRFEVYLGDDKVLRGTFRRDERDAWKLDCECVLERDMDVKEAEVCVAAEGLAEMRQKVEVAVTRKRRSKYGFRRLESILEEREVDSESEGCCCCCSEGEKELGSDGGDCRKEEEEEDEMEMEGVRWAVDVGIWVVCLGLGYLVSKASSKTLRPRRVL